MTDLSEFPEGYRAYAGECVAVREWLTGKTWLSADGWLHETVFDLLVSTRVRCQRLGLLPAKVIAFSPESFIAPPMSNQYCLFVLNGLVNHGLAEAREAVGGQIEYRWSGSTS